MIQRRGFTIVELVLVLALVGILAAAVGPPLATGLRGYVLVRDRRAFLAQGRAAMDRMVSEIRLIRSSVDVLEISSPTRFRFEYPDGTAILYEWVGTDLQRNGNILAGNVSSFVVRYYNAAGLTTSSPSALRRVRIELTLDDPGETPPLSLRTDVFLRNTGNNYDGFDVQ